jgi:ATP-dependent Clp protease protease subunit
MEKIEKDFDRDFYMSAQEAKDYGIVDEVIESLDDRKKDKD